MLDMYDFVRMILTTLLELAETFLSSLYTKVRCPCKALDLFS